MKEQGVLSTLTRSQSTDRSLPSYCRVCFWRWSCVHVFDPNSTKPLSPPWVFLKNSDKQIASFLDISNLIATFHHFSHVSRWTSIIRRLPWTSAGADSTAVDIARPLHPWLSAYQSTSAMAVLGYQAYITGPRPGLARKGQDLRALIQRAISGSPNPMVASFRLVSLNYTNILFKFVLPHVPQEGPPFNRGDRNFPWESSSQRVVCDDAWRNTDYSPSYLKFETSSISYAESRKRTVGVFFPSWIQYWVSREFTFVPRLFLARWLTSLSLHRSSSVRRGPQLLSSFWAFHLSAFALVLNFSWRKEAG